MVLNVFGLKIKCLKLKYVCFNYIMIFLFDLFII